MLWWTFCVLDRPVSRRGPGGPGPPVKILAFLSDLGYLACFFDYQRYIAKNVHGQPLLDSSCLLVQSVLLRNWKAGISENDSDR